MNNELKEDFNSLSMSERIDAFDKWLASLWITEFNEFTDHSDWMIVKIQANEKVIRRMANINTPTWILKWFVKVFSDCNLQFQRWSTVRTLWKLTASWEVIRLK
jgi:hypothetical protein